jgi:hypothetical protein
MPTYFCPNCWNEIESGAVRCPHCLYALKDDEWISYQEKLIRALEHPIRENRMLAIQLLGDLRSRLAVPAFGAILREEDDFYVIREIARALSRIGTAESRELLRSLGQHRSALVRNLVSDPSILGDLKHAWDPSVASRPRRILSHGPHRQ